MYAVSSFVGIWIDGSDFLFFFFFQAEDGIRDLTVTGVQTCALPIYLGEVRVGRRVLGLLRRELVADASELPGVEEDAAALGALVHRHGALDAPEVEIGRASCRERV